MRFIVPTPVESLPCRRDEFPATTGGTVLSLAGLALLTVLPRLWRPGYRMPPLARL